MDSQEPVNLSQLLQDLRSRFDMSGLKTLAFQLGVDWDDLPGQTRTDRARELITYLDRRGRLGELIAAAAKAYPHANWPNFPAAAALLLTMPLDHVPAVAPLPPGSRMPLAPNPLFVGRQEDLMRLAGVLRGTETVAIGQTTVRSSIAAATGLGGIGKTQLAAEFAHRYGQYFAGGVFWLSLAEPAGVEAEVAACAVPLGLNVAGLSLPEQVERVRAAWQAATPRLLVFDNCEDENLLAQWRPTTGGCRVLVTSRRRQWSRALAVQALPLGVLSRAESLTLLRGHRPDLAEDDPNLDAIAAELGDLPLALSLAGGYLESYRDDPALGSPAALLAELRDAGLLAHPALQGEDATPSPTNHSLHVGRTFALSLNRLDENDPADAAARLLLTRAACLAPGEPIPRDLLLATLRLEEKDRAGARQAARGLKRLTNLGLLETEAAGALALHRLVAAFVKRAVVDEAAQAAVEAALLAEAGRLNEAGDPRPLLAWQGHLRAVTDAAAARGDERGAVLCNELGYHLHMMGDYGGARPYVERALAIKEQVLGPQHPSTATSLNNLGALLESMGDTAGARPYYERALAIWEAALGEQHPHTQIARRNLAALDEQLAGG